MPPEDGLLTPHEAARRLKVHVTTLRRWTRAGRLPSVPYTSGTLRYRVSDLDSLTTTSLRWEAPAKAAPRPIQSAPSKLRVDGVNPITGLPYGALAAAPSPDAARAGHAGRGGRG